MAQKASAFTPSLKPLLPDGLPEFDPVQCLISRRAVNTEPEIGSGGLQEISHLKRLICSCSFVGLATPMCDIDRSNLSFRPPGEISI
jgi:hypothetical protein